jgi:hypothetical protein
MVCGMRLDYQQLSWLFAWRNGSRAHTTHPSRVKIDALLEMERPGWIAHARVLHGAAMKALGDDANNIDGISEAGGTNDAPARVTLQCSYPEQP